MMGNFPVSVIKSMGWREALDYYQDNCFRLETEAAAEEERHAIDAAKAEKVRIEIEKRKFAECLRLIREENEEADVIMRATQESVFESIATETAREARNALKASRKPPLKSSVLKTAPQDPTPLEDQKPAAEACGSVRKERRQAFT